MIKGNIWLLLTALSTFSSYAVESPHRIEFRAVFGSVDSSIEQGSTTEELNDLSSAHVGFAYNYIVHENFAIGFEKMSGDSDSFVEFSDLFTDSKLDYDLLNLVAIADFSVSKRNELYAKLIASKYDYDVIDDDEVVGSADGTDYGFGFGWRYTFDFGLGLSAGYESISMGDDVDFTGITTSVSYQF